MLPIIILKKVFLIFGLKMPKNCAFEKVAVLIFINNRAIFNFVFNSSCDHLIEWLYVFLGGAPSLSVTAMPGLGTIGLAEKEILCFKFSHDIARLHSQRVMWLNGWLSVTISHQPTKFCGHRPYRKGDIKFKIRHMTSCYPVIRES